ncbi:MAG: DUF3696 domain-containing protein [Planctomycetota bacterium]|nr:DUF3696 domain-containing protein [Planctomycetota bacterium]
MLTEMRIENFKAWRDTGSLRLAPLTVLFGANSAGKSSLGQFLLMLKQTAQSPDRSRVLHPGGDEKTPIDLGSYTDLIHRHETTRNLKFEVAWKAPTPVGFENALNKKQSMNADQFKFSCCIGMGEAAKLNCKDFTYTLMQNEKTIEVHFGPHPSEPTKYDLAATGYKLKRKRGRGWSLPAATRFYGFPDEVQAYFQNANFVSDLALELEKQLGRLLYLGPLREPPKRSYTWTGEEPESVGYRGEYAVLAALSGAKRQLSAGVRKHRRKLQTHLAEWLKQLGLIHEFELVPIAAGRREYEVLLRQTPDSSPVKLPDVGFGVSQVLPVLVQCLCVRPHSTIIMEQPEIHLHPSVQMGLADIFLETIRILEEGEDRCVQLIVESHSEYLLRRLQRRIAEGVVSPDEVAIYFCRRQGEGSVMEELRTNKHGAIENWPADFFGDQMDDVVARQMKELEGHSQENPDAD